MSGQLQDTGLQLIRNLAKIVFSGVFFLLSHLNGVGEEVLNRDSLRGVEHYRQGVQYGRMGDPERALEQFMQSLHFRRKAFGDKHLRLASNYMGMAIQYKNLRQLDNAFHYYQMAEELFLTNARESDSRLGDIYSNMGNYYRIKGNLGEAIRYQEQAVFIYDHSADEFPESNYFSAVYNLADSYYQANQEEEALELAGRFSSRGTFPHQIRWLNLIAGIHASMGNFELANSLYLQCVGMIKKEYGAADPDLADQYLSYAQFLNMFDRQGEALSWLLLAGPIYKNHPNRQVDLAELYNEIGDSWAKRKISSSSWEEFRKMRLNLLITAGEWYEKALEILTGIEKISITEIENGTSVNKLRKSNYSLPLLVSLKQTGMNHIRIARSTSPAEEVQRRTHLEKAVKYLTAGSELADYMRTGFVSEESKALFYSIQHQIFTGVVEASFELFMKDQNPEWAEIAFRFAERNKASSLWDQISELDSRSAGLIPDSLLIQESEGNTTLAWYREKLFLEMEESEPDQQKVVEYRQKIFDHEEKIRTLHQLFEKEFPAYYKIKYERDPLSFGSVRKGLKRNQILFSYSLRLPEADQEGELYTFALTTREYRLLRQPFTQSHYQMLLNLLRILTDREFLNSGKEEFRSYSESAAAFYNLLLHPFEDLIYEKKITVIPDGLLNYLPFEALLTASPDTTWVHYHDLPYLVRKHSVNYNYSATLFTRKKRGKTNHSVAFAPVYKGTVPGDHSPSALPPIPGALEEVRFLEKAVNTVLYSGGEATEKKFRETAGNYNIIHLAMHTLINDSLPLFSKLAFSAGPGDDIENDGWLNTADIYNLQLKAGMAVLGACNSGGGKLRNGEGIISLARGFFYAGCHSVLLSLWEVEDKAGTIIMKEYYRELKAGKSKDLALRNAKLKYLEMATPAAAHPRLWLSYILVGNPEPLFGRVSGYIYTILGLFLVLIAIDYFIKRERRNK